MNYLTYIITVTLENNSRWTKYNTKLIFRHKKALPSGDERAFDIEKR